MGVAGGFGAEAGESIEEEEEKLKVELMEFLQDATLARHIPATAVLQAHRQH